ncbi:MAG: hypothetical protein FI711_10580 [SAR202 cluster bacterium]|nr:hypothetical protein [Dehalococcoidia bacterium]MQG49858.1 hypothetical protein [SAR202 cluster bacterium]
MAANRTTSQIPSIYEASAIWTAIGILGLLMALFLLVFDSAIFSGVEWFVEISHSGRNSLSPETAAAVRDGIDIWPWAGIAVAVVALPLGNGRARAALTNALRPVAARQEGDVLPPDHYGRAFLLVLLGVFVFAGLSHWALRSHLDTDWLEGEDGLSEWWSVATYLAAAALAGATAWSLWATRHTKLRYLYLVMAVAFFLGAMEEISWGQRLFGWGTPSAIEQINFQDETTIHNVNFANNVIYEALFWGSALGLTGGVWRLTANLRGLSDRMRMFLPSLTLAPALLLILAWRTGDLWENANIIRLVMDHFNHGPRGSEVPEVMLGLCIVVYTFTNLQKARYLRRLAGAATSANVREIARERL